MGRGALKHSGINRVDVSTIPLPFLAYHSNICLYTKDRVFLTDQRFLDH